MQRFTGMGRFRPVEEPRRSNKIKHLNSSEENHHGSSCSSKTRVFWWQQKGGALLKAGDWVKARIIAKLGNTSKAGGDFAVKEIEILPGVKMTYFD
jgi:hypothetical protein